MKKWIIACGCLVAIVLSLIAIMVWQNQNVKRELLKEYILEHASARQSLGAAIDGYEQSQDVQQLADNLVITYGMSMVVLNKPPNLSQLNGISYTTGVNYLFEIRDQFDYYLPVAIKETIDASRDGEITEKEYQKLLGYYQLLQEFNELTMTDDFGEKKSADFEKDFETFYLDNKEEISALIN